MANHLGDDNDGNPTKCQVCDEDDADDKDFFCWMKKKKANKEEEFSLKMTDKEWIRELCEWADATRTRDLPFLMLLQKLVLMGQVKMEEVTLSLSTVKRIRKQERIRAGRSIADAEFDDFVILHFDGKKTPMGDQQGGGVKEHVPVIVSGVSGEYQLGIEIAPNATGNTKDYESNR